jgi:hypothetical protein
MPCAHLPLRLSGAADRLIGDLGDGALTRMADRSAAAAVPACGHK